MPFAVPMVWRELRSRLDDWFFCITNTTGFSKKSKHKIECPSIGSSKVSFKAILLHNVSKHLSIPLAHAEHMKETYAKIQGLLGGKNVTKATSGTYVLT